MATYKVIQDIEAEDKFLGPLTLKQFVFGAAGIFFGYLSFFAVIQGFPAALIVFAPPMLLGFFLAIPWSKDQPTEVWVLAKIRFRLKPKVRIWDQSGMEELVTITAPKKEEKVLTNNLNQTEVRSRLKALAETIDSRGWAVKHADMNSAMAPQLTTDRLVNPSVFPREVPNIDINSVPDVMATGTPNLDNMLQQSTELRMQQNLDKLDRIRHGEPLESIQQPAISFTPPPTSYGTVDASTEEAMLTEQLKARRVPEISQASNMHRLDPAGPVAQQQPQEPNFAPTEQAQAPIPSTPNPAIMNYVDNDDLDVATIGRQLNKQTHDDDSEVVINLH